MQADGLDGAGAIHWATQVTVRVVLADADVSSLEQPPALYFQVPRQSYLHAILPQALSLLHHLLPPVEHTPWLDYNSLPLKWNVPAGVMYDLLVPQHEEPWPLTLHVRRFPAAILPAYGGPAALRGSLLMSLKEAAFICCGSAKRVVMMSEGAQSELWEAVLHADAARHLEVLRSLPLEPATRGEEGPFVPVRAYIRAGGGGYLSSYADITYTSRPVAATAKGGSAATLRDVLLSLVRAVLPPPWLGSDARGPEPPNEDVKAGGCAGNEGCSTAEASGGEGLGQADAGRASGQDEVERAVERTDAAGTSPPPNGLGHADVERALERVYVAGISPPLDVPLVLLHRHLHGPDSFLYIVAHLRAPAKH